MKVKNYEARHFVIFFTHLSRRSVIFEHELEIYFTAQIDLD